MRCNAVTICALVLALVCPIATGGDTRPRDRHGPGTTRTTTRPVPPEVAAATDELWRRGRCLLSSVYEPAEKESVLPADLGATPVLAPRVYSAKRAIACYVVRGPDLWVADDQRILRFDSSGRLVRNYTRAEGLPVEPVQSLAATDTDLWAATRSGLYRLSLSGVEKFEPVPGVAFSLGKVVVDGPSVWVVSDQGAWRGIGGQWTKLPDMPALRRIAESTRRGFWMARWRDRLDGAISVVLPMGDDLYVVCFNQLVRYNAKASRWDVLAAQAWGLASQGRTLWTMTPSGVFRFDPATGRAQAIDGGSGPATGRPVALAAGNEAVYLLSEGEYDRARQRYVGGGISCYTPAQDKWSITEQIDGVDVRFATSILVDGDEVWVACKLYDRVLEMGAHPGMAHIKRWLPHPSGIGLAHRRNGNWQLLRMENLKTDPRWILGQHGTLAPDRLGPETVERMCRVGEQLWGACRIVPEHWYSAYIHSAGELARRDGHGWTSHLAMRTGELGLLGEQPGVLLASGSHGDTIVMADGQPAVLGVEALGGRPWVIAENGVFVRDAITGRMASAEGTAPHDFHTYWRATAACADRSGVWIGGDSGTLSHFDSRTGVVTLAGVLPGRRITSIGRTSAGITVRGEKAKVRLPFSLASAPRLPDVDLIAFDGQSWRQASEAAPVTALAYSCREKSNLLYREGKPVGFLRGVYRPAPLCEEADGKALWLSTYDGPARVELQEARR